MPAHLTVIHPFVPPGEVDDELLDRLGRAVAAVPAFDVAFRRTAWFGRDVLWLAPEPAQPFRDLTAAVFAAFPDHPPYGGAFDGSAPHLTVGERRFEDLAALQRAETAVAAHLPLTARIDRVQLVAGSDAPGSWALVRELPLAPPPRLPVTRAREPARQEHLPQRRWWSGHRGRSDAREARGGDGVAQDPHLPLLAAEGRPR